MQRAIDGLTTIGPADLSEQALEALSQRVRTLRTSLQEALKAAFPEPKKEGEPRSPSGLEDGTFEQALKQVIDRRVEVARKRAEHEEVLLSSTDDESSLSLSPPPNPQDVAWGQAPDNSTWVLTLVSPMSPVIGRPMVLSALPVPSEGRPLPRIAVRWFIDGEKVKEGPPGDLLLLHTPRRSGRMDVRAEATEVPQGPPRSARIALQVLAAQEAPQPDWQDRLRQTERLQTFILGLLIVLIGFVIFAKTFVGTVEDFLAVLLWGFTADIGVTKVLEVGMPFVNRTAPARAPAT